MLLIVKEHLNRSTLCPFRVHMRARQTKKVLLRAARAGHGSVEGHVRSVMRTLQRGREEEMFALHTPTARWGVPNESSAKQRGPPQDPARRSRGVMDDTDAARQNGPVASKRAKLVHNIG